MPEHITPCNTPCMELVSDIEQHAGKRPECERIDQISSENEEPEIPLRKSAERHFIWKLDLIILPILGLIYFTHSLDRANLANAKTDNIEADLGLQDNQYSLVLILFYIPYSTLNIPTTILARRVSPPPVISVLMFLWGVISASSAALESFGGLVATRVFLGVVEAGFLPCAFFYLSMFYKPDEIASRASIFHVMGFVANAFGGLIAWHVFQWHRVLNNWQYLFIIEGSMTLPLAIAVFFLLPSSVDTSIYFNAIDRAVARQRAASSTKLAGADANEAFSWGATLAPLLRPSVTWLYGLTALSYGVACASVNNFLPTMIRRLTSDTVTANLYTVAPNLVGAACIVATCAASDRLRVRAPFVVVCAAVSTVAFILLGTMDMKAHPGVGYACTFLIIAGTFTAAVLVPAWAAGNTPSPNARATTLGLIIGMQSLGGIVSSPTFRSQDAPVYRPALITCGVFLGCVVVLVVGMAAYFWRENRKLREKGDDARLYMI